jgi:hypothetical protein
MLIILRASAQKTLIVSISQLINLSTNQLIN